MTARAPVEGMPDDDGGEAGQGPMSGLSTRRRRTLIALGLLRASGIAVLLVALYYLLPLDRPSPSSLVVALVLCLLVLVTTMYWEVRAIVRARFPGIRATQALATTVPLFLLVFAATYFMIAFQDPTTFSEPLTRSDALYFTITTFATVGFGDIAPRSEPVRLLVAAQVLLDLVILGLGIQVIFGAVKKARTS
ncbi:potassium channel family protein [Oerskovia enterophila]|uniref:Voltage-gated potassium channel n=1 Tax=Oerskovia enterophila TaxID=43678 RepID=A0ABX2Y2Z0_9CELL|nr:potassium channel family protein [Oerskovia enterophila]OCI30927.1 voltage-gated potassium channel [Oerskovia enterophila]